MRKASACITVTTGPSRSTTMAAGIIIGIIIIGIIGVPWS